ncbi:MAG: family 20 glycosylhydrolase [Anaerolineae bacterium]|nr:family 20 glycosylhydrolase [Anaerolineae bacterium]
MSQAFILLPTPRRITALAGTATLHADRLITLDSSDPQALFFTAKNLQQALRTHAAVDWSIVAGTALAAEQIGLRLSVVPGSTSHPQGYRLIITAKGISIISATPTGLFYGSQTFIQILSQQPNPLPCLHIDDWPDFDQRGVMLDISRDKVPTMATLFDLVDRLAAWKINQLQLYTEHTFAYRNHPEVWANASPMTGQEILKLDAYCRERFIELVPNQNTFGHMRRWLTHPRYRPLAECPDGCDTEWGYFDEPFTLCPSDPGSIELIRTLMDELLPHFSSRQFNIGGDETVDLGQGRSREAVAERGKGRVYLDFLLKIYREVKARGRTMQFWGDIIMAYPDLVPELPRDSIVMEWGYEADHPFDEHGAKFAEAGLPYYVCPGTSGWNTIAGRTTNAIENLRSAAANGLKHGAIGYLITDWGDNGHWQPLPVSYLGFGYGAALAWAYEANHDHDVARLISRHAFEDTTGTWGRVAADLGDAYLQPDLLIDNNSILFKLLQETPQEITARTDLRPEKLCETLAYVNQVMADLSQVHSTRPDADLLQREFQWVAAMLRHACRRGLWILDNTDTTPRHQLAQEAADLLAEHRFIWLARNRSGGLADSQARLEKMRRDYE